MTSQRCNYQNRRLASVIFKISILTMPLLKMWSSSFRHSQFHSNTNFQNISKFQNTQNAPKMLQMFFNVPQTHSRFLNVPCYKLRGEHITDICYWLVGEFSDTQNYKLYSINYVNHQTTLFYSSLKIVGHKANFFPHNIP